MDPISLALGLLPLVGKVLPSIVPALATPLSGNILSKVAKVAQSVFGTMDANQIDLKIQEDKSKLDEFKAKLEAETQEEVAFLADVQSARQMTSGLAHDKSILAWGAPILSIITTCGFFGSLGLLFFHPIQVTSEQWTVVVAMFGSLGTAYGMVQSFWLGSSRSGQANSEQMANLAINTVPASALKQAMTNGNGH